MKIIAKNIKKVDDPALVTWRRYELPQNKAYNLQAAQDALLLDDGVALDVLVAMSGGVDSSVAAYILTQKYNCMGAMMKLFNSDECESGCCGLNDALDARSVANALNMPFHVFNFTQDFEQNVIKRFAAEYARGRTPNPCIDCNKYLKFEKFLNRARELNIPKIATGHYAKIEFDKVANRHLLRKSVDDTKDQTYALYTLTQTQLSSLILPLGDLTKVEVREIAHEMNFLNAAKKDSQDICFAPDGNYAKIVKQYHPNAGKIGNFVDMHGNVLGKHRGIINYTYGQRKGLNISASAPLYVSNIDAINNRVTLVTQENLGGKNLIANNINLIACEDLSRGMEIQAKIRYNMEAQPAKVWQIGEDEIRVEFKEMQRAITPGQAVVLYDDDVVVGGGIIR